MVVCDAESVDIGEDFQGYDPIDQDPNEKFEKFPEATRSAWELFLNRSDVLNDICGQFDDGEFSISADVESLSVDPKVPRPSTSVLMRSSVENERSFDQNDDSEVDSEGSYFAEQGRGERIVVTGENRIMSIAQSSVHH